MKGFRLGGDVELTALKAEMARRSERSQMRGDDNLHRVDTLRSGAVNLRPTPQGAGASSTSADNAPPSAGRSPAAASVGTIYPLVGLCRAAGLPLPIPEYRFDTVRKFRFDYAWPLRKVAAEVDGGVWTQGRHTRGLGFIEDQRKTNLAAKLGWYVMRYTPDRLGECIADLRIMFAGDAA